MNQKAGGNGFRYKLFVFDLDETLWTVSEGLTTLVRPPFQRPSPDKIENEHGFWVELRPGVRDLFDHIKSRGGYISIASRNDSGPTLEILEALDLVKYLDFPQFAWRPKEESILRIIKEIRKRDKVSVKPSEVLFVDDWPENIVPVRAWGATALLYGQDFETYQELKTMLR
jgi:magnesium-dependent phosphatase-1